MQPTRGRPAFVDRNKAPNVFAADDAPGLPVAPRAGSRVAGRPPHHAYDVPVSMSFIECLADTSS